MIMLDNTDVLEAWSDTDAKVDCTIHGLVGSTFTNLYTGTLGNGANTVVYTAGAAISVVSATFMNTDSSAVTVNFKLDPANGGNDKFLMPIVSLGAGYSVFFDGQRCTVMNASGAILSTVSGWEDGATTEILVGGGAGSAPVWTTATGTGAPVRADGPTTHDSLIRAQSSESVADEAEITLATGVSGWGFAQAGDNEQWIQFSFTAAGVVTVIANSALAVNTDTDGNLCVYDAGAGIAIKNRLGATKTIRYVVNYSA